MVISTVISTIIKIHGNPEVKVKEPKERDGWEIAGDPGFQVLGPRTCWHLCDRRL